MLTLNDLKIERQSFGREATIWERVETPDGRKFLVGSCDMSPMAEALSALERGEDVTKPEGFSEEDILVFLLGMVPERETWVMEAKVGEDGNWIPANECGPHCETGVCNKRLASDKTVASQEHGYNLLLGALNA